MIMKKIPRREFFNSNEKIVMTHSVWGPELVPHTHDFFEIAYILKGSGYHYLNGNRHEVFEGNLFLLTPKSEHNFVAITEPFEWANVLFVPSVIDESLLDTIDIKEIVKALIFSDAIHYDTASLSDIELNKNMYNLNRIFHEMQNEYDAKEPGYQDVLKSYLQILLVKIFRAHFLEAGTTKTGKQNSKIADMVFEYLRENSFNDDLNIEQLAKRAFYSPQYLRKIFRQETGIPLGAFIRNKRMELAHELLLSTDLSVAKIMEKVGFHDSKSFYLAFKKKFGTTPMRLKEGKSDD